jgi:hypothetical protein
MVQVDSQRRRAAQLRPRPGTYPDDPDRPTITIGEPSRAKTLSLGCDRCPVGGSAAAGSPSQARRSTAYGGNARCAEHPALQGPHGLHRRMRGVAAQLRQQIADQPASNSGEAAFQFGNARVSLATPWKSRNIHDTSLPAGGDGCPPGRWHRSYWVSWPPPLPAAASDLWRWTVSQSVVPALDATAGTGLSGADRATSRPSPRVRVVAESLGGGTEFRLAGTLSVLSEEYDYEPRVSESWVQISILHLMLRRDRSDKEHQGPASNYPKPSRKAA